MEVGIVQQVSKNPITLRRVLGAVGHSERKCDHLYCSGKFDYEIKHSLEGSVRRRLCVVVVHRNKQAPAGARAPRRRRGVNGNSRARCRLSSTITRSCYGQYTHLLNLIILDRLCTTCKSELWFGDTLLYPLRSSPVVHTTLRNTTANRRALLNPRCPPKRLLARDGLCTSTSFLWNC